MREKVRPIGPLVVVEREKPPEKSKGGIVLTDKSKGKENRGVVVSVGTGKIYESGFQETMPVKAGDHVLFSEHAGREMEYSQTLESQKVFILHVDEILGVIEQTE